MKYSNINITIENNHILIITINRPKYLNALNRLTINEINSCLSEFKNDKKIKVIIITGNGEKAFIAGADIKEFMLFNKNEGKALSKEGQNKLFDYIENYPKPVISAINGYALGGGLEVALASHIRTASQEAKMGLPESSLGIIPGYGGTQRLPQIIGKGRAFEMMFTAKMINAQQAFNWGLVNHIFPVNELINETINLANQIIKTSSNAHTNIIKSVNDGYKNTDGYQTEIDSFGNCFGTKDFTEGTAAFLEKRKTNF